jgi:hypothetical protein
MKTSQKILFFATIVAFVTFVAGMLAAGSCNYEYGKEVPGIKTVGNIIAGVGAIMSFVMLEIWAIILLRKILSLGKDFLFHLFMWGLFPFFLSVFFLSTFMLILDLGYLGKCTRTVYEDIWWNLLGLIGSPVFWITFGFAEIIIAGLLIFNKNSADHTLLEK